jgi:spore maturation protein CgeB
LWAKKATQKFNVEVLPLLQATNPNKFRPNINEPDSGDEILFVGNTRNVYRQIIKDCVESGITPSIYGKDWDRFVPKDLIKGTFIPNDQLASKYRAAGVVLNDHWPDMAREGFLSNRLFDAVASGARVVSDDAVGIKEAFGESVAVYKSPGELADLCAMRSRGAWGTESKIIERANRVGQIHSFDQRASSLIREVSRFVE